MKRIILISICLLLGFGFAHSQKFLIKSLNTETIKIGGKVLKKEQAFMANEKISWNKKGQSMRIMFQDGEKRGLCIIVCREALERIGAQNVAQYLCWCNQTWFERFKSNFGLIVNNKPSSRSSVELMEKTASNFPEKRLALVIGNSNYEYLDPLANPLNDVTKVAEKLQSLGFDVLPVYDADDREINSKLNWLKRQSKYDVVVVYYSGHGIQNGNKQYLIPVNGKLDDENDLDYCISLEDVYESLNALGKDKTKMIFVDACRNQGKWQSKIEADSRQEGEDIAVLYSTSTGSKASDGEAGENSPFAQAFLEEIGNPTDNVTTTIGKIKNAVKEKSNQIPIDINFTGQTFTFNPHGTEKTQQEGISLTTNMAVIKSVAEGKINAEQTGYSAETDLDNFGIKVDISNSVTSILDKGFKDCDELSCISIPETVTKIGNNVFEGCGNLCEIDIASNNPKYDSRDNCNAIIETSINTLIAGCSETIIPNSVTSIGSNAFKDCRRLTSITIPNSITNIGISAFEGCMWLSCIIIPNSVTDIGNYAFKDCSTLSDITIPSSVKSIGDGAFDGCKKLTSVIIPNSVTEIGSHAFNGCTGLKSVTIPNTVTKIGSNAFDGCTGIASVTIPNSVTSIGDWAFYGCTGLTSIIIPNSVTEIGDGAFYGCTGLTSVTIPNSVTEIGDGAFDGCTGLTSIIIPNSVTKIGSHAFDDCTSLSSIIIPNSVTEIGDGAFDDCTGLTSIIIPNSVTKIGSHAFDDCTSLSSIIIPNSVTEIGDCAFDGCTGLTSIIIPNSVTKIGTHAFYGCTSLSSIIIPNSVTEIGDGAFENTPWVNNQPDGLLYIGRVAYKYKGVMPERTTIKIKEGTTAIGEAFSDCTGLTSITIPNSVTSIGYGAFSGCTSLTSITIPNSVTSIGYGAFSGCTSLTSIIIPNSVTEIGGDAFEETPWFNNQPDGLLYIGRVAYKYKGEMPERASIVIKEGTISIGSSAFADCDGLTSVIIPNSVTTIGECVFFGCTNLSSLTIPSSVNTIEELAFYGTGLKHIYIMKITPPKYKYIEDTEIHVWCIIHVPKGCKEIYKKEMPWCVCKDIVDDL